MSIPLKKVIKSQRRQEKIEAEKHYKTARKQRISTYVSIITLKYCLGLVVQWLRLQASNERGGRC